MELQLHLKSKTRGRRESGGSKTKKQLTDDGRLQIDENSSRHELASAGLREEGVEGLLALGVGVDVHRATNLLGKSDAIGLDAVLQAVQLPTRVADLNAGLTNVDRDTLTL